MFKPLDQAALRAAAIAPPVEIPDWVQVGSLAYSVVHHGNVTVVGYLGNIANVEWRGQTYQVPIAQLDVPRQEFRPIDLGAITHDTYRAIATDYFDELNAVKILPGQTATFSPLPDSLHPHLKAALKTIGISQFYCHQTQAWQSLQSEGSVVLVTPTASGKTWCFVPHAFQIALTSGQTSLLIYPLRALAGDQDEKLLSLNQALPSGSRLFIARCTGDIPLATRKAYFQGTSCPQIVLISPDVLHHLLYHTNKSQMRGWQEFLKRLGLVVCDESHSYLSSFGIHFTNVLRRLRLACANVGHPSAPLSWVISTATLSNPQELASQLSGLTPEQITLIDRSGAEAHERTLMVMQPQVAPNFTATTLLSRLLKDGLKGLLFVNSRRSAKHIFTLFSHQMGGRCYGVELFHGSLTATRRRQLLDQLSQGQIQILITTNCLEAGIDLPVVDFVALRGSTSLNSFWQRAGRCGRRGPGLIIFIPDASHHIDYYYAHQPERLFAPVEKIQIQPNYPAVLSRHLLCAAAEGGINSECLSQYFGQGSERLAAELLKQKKLFWSRSGVLWLKGYPHRQVSLRGIANDTVSLLEADGAEVLEEMPLNLAHRECYPQAIYLSSEEGETVTWRCQSLEGNQAILKRVAQEDRRTQPNVNLDVTLSAQLAPPKVVATALDGGNLRLSLWWGTLSEQVSGYQEVQLHYAPTCTNRTCVQFHQPQPTGRKNCPYCRHRLSERLNSKEMEQVDFESPLSTRFEAPVLRIEVNFSLAAALQDQAKQLREQLLAQYGSEAEVPPQQAALFEFPPLHLALHSLSHLVIKAVPVLFLASEQDLSSLSVERPSQNQGNAHSQIVYLYDAVDEGCGTAEAVFENWRETFSKALSLASDCDCGDLGCPRCLHSHGCPEANEALSKLLGVWLLSLIVG